MSKNNLAQNHILGLIILFILLSLNACNPIGPNPTPQNIWVETTEAIKTIVDNEEFILPNCGGTSELSQSLGTQTTVKQSVVIGDKARLTAGGEVEIPELAKLELKGEVERAYQQTYEMASSRLDSIEMKAAPGTHVVYVIQWEEQRFESDVSYAIENEVYLAPYTYILRVPKISTSYQESCLGETVESEPNTTPQRPSEVPTQAPTATPVPTYTPYPTYTPNIPTPTATPVGVLPETAFWKQDGVSFGFTKITFYGNEICLRPKLINNTPYTLNFRFSIPEDMNISNNLGEVLKLYSIKGMAYYDTWSSDISVESGQYTSIISGLSFCFVGTITDPSVEYLIVTVNISKIKNGKWKIDIHH